MALPRSLKISEQANKLGSFLAHETEEAGALVEVLANQRHLWETIFGMATDSDPRILICFNGETSRGGFNERNTLCRVDREWVVVVMRGHGFKHAMNETSPKEGLTTLFYDDCEAVRQLIRRCIGISEEVIDYVSMKPLPGVAQPQAANVFLDGYVITFLTANDIPAITNTAPGQ
jgi:hypothetical protein